MNAITVCVNYSDMLALTLPRNAHHFEHISIITTPDDEATWMVVDGIPNAWLHTTNSFYRNGALFNKGLAIEETIDAENCEGWLMILDADILLPDKLPEFTAGNLYSPYRRMCYDPSRWNEKDDWRQYQLYPDKEFAGYCQVFNCADPVLQTRQWYGTDWTHAGGCDSDFQARWPADKKIRPDFEVLHFGAPMKNWGGRSAEQQRKLQQLLSQRRRVGDYARERLPHG